MALFEGIDLTGLIVALLLPWLTGVALVAAALPGTRWSIVVGQGYLVGLMVVIAVLLSLDGLGAHLSFEAPAVILGLVALLAVIPWWRQGGRIRPEWPKGRQFWHLVWILPLLAFLIERGGVLAQELVLRPLFAWDAWMNWVPRAVVWFHHESLTPFELPSEWLEQSSDSVVYTLGNRRASEYPVGVPLLLLWHMLGAGTADHTLLYLPWLLLPATMALALWGHLRESGTPVAIAALAVYALLSLPLLEVHAMLAGYADLWLAAAFGLGAMALSTAARTNCPRYLLLVGQAALACFAFKTPGLFFGSLLALGIVLNWLNVSARWVSVAGMVLAGGVVAALLAGWLLPAGWPHGGLTLPLSGALPDLDLMAQPLLPYLLESVLIDANWHLLWPLLLLVLIAAVVVEGRRAFEAPDMLLLLAGLAFLIAVFGFTHYFRQAVNSVTFNRALLYLVPLMVYVSFHALGSWIGGGSRRGDGS
jgi:hypothetical protein